jgi:hypothetical protein
VKLNYSKTLWKRIQKHSNEILHSNLTWNVMLISHGHYMHAHAMLSAAHTPALTQLWFHTETKLYSNQGHWRVAYKWQVLYKADISETRNFNEVHHGSYTVRKMLLYDNSVMCTYHHFTVYYHGTTHWCMQCVDSN